MREKLWTCSCMPLRPGRYLPIRPLRLRFLIPRLMSWRSRRRRKPKVCRPEEHKRRPPTDTLSVRLGALMPSLITQPTRIRSAGNKPKLIDEYIGRVNSGTSAVSVAHMRSPEGWEEPKQTPEFDEFTIVLKGTMRVQHAGGELEVKAGQAVIA